MWRLPFGQSSRWSQCWEHSSAGPVIKRTVDIGNIWKWCHGSTRHWRGNDSSDSMTLIQKTDSRSSPPHPPHAFFGSDAPRLWCNSFKCPSGYDPQLCCHYLYSQKAENTLNMTFPLRVVWDFQSTSPLHGLLTKTRPNTSVFSIWLGLYCVDIHVCSVNRLLLWPIPKIRLFLLFFVVAIHKVSNSLLFRNVAVEMDIISTLSNAIYLWPVPLFLHVEEGIK